MAQNCSCYQVWFDYAGHNSVSNCTCFQSCDVCDHVTYGVLNAPINNTMPYRSCTCYSSCYLEGLSCSCNAMANMKEKTIIDRDTITGTDNIVNLTKEDCGCDHMCYLYQKCSIDGCESYTACQCDGASDRYPCAQCDLSQYDINAPKYYCPCDSTCDSYVAPQCNCDGQFQASNPVKCGVNSFEEQCEIYTSNLDWNYIDSRYC